MPINQTSNSQIQTDIVSRYGIQKKQQRNNQLKQIQQRETTDRNNTTSPQDVRVTLSRQGRAKNASRTANIPDAEAQQKTQEPRNIEFQRAVQAYQNTNRVAENTSLENTRQRQINRIIG